MKFILKALVQEMGRSMLIREPSKALSMLCGVGNSVLHFVACWVMNGCTEKLLFMLLQQFICGMSVYHCKLCIISAKNIISIKQNFDRRKFGKETLHILI